MNEITKFIEAINAFNPTPLTIAGLALVSVIAIIGFAIITVIKT